MLVLTERDAPRVVGTLSESPDSVDWFTLLVELNDRLVWVRDLAEI